MPINIPSLITNTGNEQALFAQAGATSGVTSLNSLTGDLTLQAVAGSIAISGIGNALTLTTTGRPQAPSTVSATGAITSTGSISAGTSLNSSGALIVGTSATIGTALTAATIGGTFMGTTTANPADLTPRQTVNFVIGNTRIQCGQAIGNGGSNYSVTYATPFTGLPIVWVTPTDGTNFSNVTSRSNTVVSGSTAAAAPVFWMAIGPA